MAIKIEQLTSLKKRVDALRDAKATMEGEIKSLQGRLKNDFNVTSIAEAEALIAQLQTEITALEASLEESVTRLTAKITEIENAIRT
jgi:uncharacterized small protein (DUF1192 family)